MCGPPKSGKALRGKEYRKALLLGDGILLNSEFYVYNGGSERDGLVNCSNTDKKGETNPRSSHSDKAPLESISSASSGTYMNDNDQAKSNNYLNSQLENSDSSKPTKADEKNEDIPHPTVSRKPSVGTVIPYGRILNAKFLNETLAKENRSSHTNSGCPNYYSSGNENSNSVYSCSRNDLSRDLRSNLDANENINRPCKIDEDCLIEITIAKASGQDIVPERLVLSVQNMEFASNVDVVQEILKRSYNNTRRGRSILVIINPHGGKGNAKKLFMNKCKPILQGSKCSIDVVYTKYAMHASDIAREMDIDKYDTVACASGDGIPYEVINGLFQRADRVKAFNKVAVTQLPCGSGNAMSVSCHWTSNPSYAALCLVKSVESRIDLMCCSQQSYSKKCPRVSFLSQTYGVIAESDINTNFIRWMGPSRFQLGVAYNVIRKKKFPCDIYVKYAAKSKSELKLHYLEYKNNSSRKLQRNDSDRNSGKATASEVKNVNTEPVTENTFKLQYPLDDGVPDDWEKIDPGVADNLGIFYTGKMPYIAANTKFFPAALPSDGTMDLIITDARTPVSRMAPILLGLDQGTHVLQSEVIHSKIIAYKLVPKMTSGAIYVDGEKYPLEPLQVEILPRLCKTLLKNGRYADTEFESMQ